MTTTPSIAGAEAGTASTASIGQLVAAVREDVSELVRDEIDLAKAEMKEDAKAAGLGGAFVGAAAMFAVLAVILLSIALAYGISALGLGLGWAFLIVGGFYLLLAGVLGLLARRSFGSVKGPKRAQSAAVQTVKALRAPSEP